MAVRHREECWTRARHDAHVHASISLCNGRLCRRLHQPHGLLACATSAQKHTSPRRARAYPNPLRHPSPGSEEWVCDARECYYVRTDRTGDAWHHRPPMAAAILPGSALRSTPTASCTKTTLASTTRHRGGGTRAAVTRGSSCAQPNNFNGELETREPVTQGGRFGGAPPWPGEEHHRRTPPLLQCSVCLMPIRPGNTAAPSTSQSD